MSIPDPPHIDGIKDALRACRTLAEVDACVRTHAAAVAALDANPGTRLHAIDIRHLAAWKRRAIRGGAAQRPPTGT